MNERNSFIEFLCDLTICNSTSLFYHYTEQVGRRCQDAYALYINKNSRALWAVSSALAGIPRVSRKWREMSMCPGPQQFIHACSFLFTDKLSFSLSVTNCSNTLLFGHCRVLSNSVSKILWCRHTEGWRGSIVCAYCDNYDKGVLQSVLSDYSNGSSWPL